MNISFSDALFFSHPPNSYSCDDCDNSFRELTLLDFHKEAKHKGNVGNECSKISTLEKHNSKNDTEILKQKRKYNNLQRLHCKKCNFIFFKTIDLTKHRRCMHPQKRCGEFQCETCIKLFKTKNGLTMHQQSIHEEVKTKCKFCKYKGFEINSHISKQHGAYKYICDKCDYKTSYRRSFKCHIISKHLITAQNSKKNNLRFLSQKVNTSEGVKYKCSECDYKTTLSQNIYKHGYMKHGDDIQNKILNEILQNNISNRARNFGDQSYIESHIRTVPSISKLADNDSVPTNNEISTTDKHMTSTHSTMESQTSTQTNKFEQPVVKNEEIEPIHDFTQVENKFECTKCSNSYNNPKTLKAHIESIHVGKKFKCQQCSFSGYYLYKHVLLQHGKTKMCEHCGYKTSQKSNLVSHKLAKHSNILNISAANLKCNTCNFTASKKGALRSHIHYKHEDRKYLCGVCAYTSVSKLDMNNHKRSEHNGKDYKCDQCSYGPARYDQLLRHTMQSHSPINNS